MGTPTLPPCWIGADCGLARTPSGTLSRAHNARRPQIALPPDKEGPGERIGEASSSGLAVPEIPEVSVVVPVYRSVETLRELHRRLCRTLEAQMLSFEVLFVDDACPVGSFTVLDELARRDSRVAVLALERNVGQHRAVLAGLAH